MRFALVLASAVVLAAFAVADDRWTFVRSGPFEVWTNGSDKQARLRLLEAEQFRHAFGYLLGKPDLRTTFPIRIYLMKDKKAARVTNQLRPVRDLLVSNIYGEDELSPEWRRAMARHLLEANAKRFAPDVEEGLIEVLAPVEVTGTRITVVATDAAHRTPGWAKIHLLTTDPRFAGKLRVYLSNIENGVDDNAASKNAFETPSAEINRLAAEHIRKSAFEPANLPGRPLSWERDFPVRNPSPEQQKVASVDAGTGGRYEDLTGAEALESQGEFAKAIEAGSKSAAAWLEYGKAQKDPAQFTAAFKKAAEINPNWAAPHVEQAKRETVPAKAVASWKLAAALAPRDTAIWKAYALSATSANLFNDAAKAWAGAERAAATDAERDEIRKSRLAIEEQRAEYTEAERQKARAEREREMQRLKNETLTSIREAEAAANARLGGSTPPPANAEKWWDDKLGPKQRLEGMLERVDCNAKGPGRLAIREGGKLTLIQVVNPTRIAIVGAKETTLQCGPQRPPKKVVVEYTAKGGLAVIEFKAAQ